jgi:hypothetical protein
VDASGGERLARVRIRIDGADHETISNEIGEFTFDDLPPGEHTLIAETVGYRLYRQSIVISTDQTTTVTIPLTGDTVRLTEQVTVTADPFAPSVPASPSQTRIGGAEIRNLSSVLLDDPMRSMTTLPGVAGRDDYHSSFSVRGAPFARVGVYLDDVPIHAPTHTFGGLGDGYSISALNDQMLGGMTLMPAAPPPAFGGAGGASLAAETRDGSRDQTAFHGSIGISDISVLGEGPLTSDKRGSWLVAARKSHLAYVTKELGGNGDEQVRFSDVQGKVTFDVTPKNTLSVHMLAGESSFGAGSLDSSATPDDQSIAVQRRVASAAESSGSTDLIKANWRFVPSPAAIISTTATYQHSRDDARLQTNDTLASTRYSDGAAQMRLSWVWTPAVAVRAGYAVHRSFQNGTSYLSLFEDPQFRRANAYDGHADSQDAFAEQDWTSSSGQARVTGGLRWQRNSMTSNQPVLPYASASFNLTSQSKVEVGWGRYAQFPEIDMAMLARPGEPLSPERSTHYVAAFEHRLDAQTRVRIEAYAREDRDLFDAPDVFPRLHDGRVVWPSAPPRWRNAYDGYSRGMEIVLQRRSASRLTGWVGYTLGYNREHDRSTGVWFDSDNDIRHELNLYASYRLTPSVNLSARFNYATGTPVPGYFSITDFTTEDSVVTDHRNGSRFQPYERLDLRINKSFAHEHWKMTLYAEALNATNHRNLRYMGGGGNFSDQAWARLGSTAPLLPSVGLAVDF